MKESFFRRIDKWHLGYIGFLVIAIIMFPIVFLCIRDGNGSAIFQMHDQYDETILNYVFPIRYFGVSEYEQMMCGVPAEALKPFCPIFVPLYQIFSVYTAFIVQYVIVIFTAFFGMYFCIKQLTRSSVASVIAATVFTFLPVHSIYGNVVMGTPLLIFLILKIREGKKAQKIWSIIGIIYYGLSTSFVLSGWAAVGFILLAFIVFSIYKKKPDRDLLIVFCTLLITYLVCNIDLLIELLLSDSYISHRVEFSLDHGTPFLTSLVGILTNGNHVYEAESKHEWLFIPVAVALLLLVFVKSTREYLKMYVAAIASVIGLAVLYAFLATPFVCDIKNKFPGMLSSFGITRVYYFIPGIMYILLGISCAVVIKSFPERMSFISYVLSVILCAPCLLFIIKDKDGIFYQNVNQVNNGQDVTGYITMRNLYSEELMTEIENAIGKDMSSYRVVSIGISPVVSLMHGFYTIDGYSNNYDVEYKHQFREVIAGELEQNDYIKAYFDQWGNRCYAFYHEWGDSYMLGAEFDGQIMDLRLNIDKMKEMNCQYIFSAAEICDCEQYGLSFLGDYSEEPSYWQIWVYEVR